LTVKSATALQRVSKESADGHELLRRRDLLWNLVLAELTARYKTTTLGVLWFILNPLLLMLILVAVFDHFIQLKIANYPVFVFSALLPWTFFQMGVENAGTSIPRASGLVKRVRVPRAFIPISAVLASLVHFLISLVILFALMVALNVPMTVNVVWLPAVIFVQTVLVLGISLLVASLNVFYRDVEHVLSPALLGLFYLTPVFYPLSYVPPAWLRWYILNPMVGIVATYRRTLVDGALPPWRALATSALTSLVLLVIGALVFRRVEPYFDDYV
jgi:ABC-type polysaccharide/polyol phosphate export permease